MKIAVCMKQVPAYSEGNMDEKTGLIIRSGLEAVVNVYDMAALEAALRIKEQRGGQIDVFTMGPLGAGQVLREAYALGADQGYLISDRSFGGADVLATSYTLMQAIMSQGNYDLILCGKQTTDGDTGQVSGALARWIGMAHYTGIVDVSAAEGEEIIMKQIFEDRSMVWQVEPPCLLAVERTAFIPRMPSLKLRMAGKKKDIQTIDLSDLTDQETDHYGLKGSATRVKKIFPPERTPQSEIKIMEGKKAAQYIIKTIQGIQDTKGAVS